MGKLDEKNMNDDASSLFYFFLYLLNQANHIANF